MAPRDSRTKLLVALIVLATAAFAIGAAIERSGQHDEGAVEAAAAGSLVGDGQSFFASEAAGEEGESGESAEPAEPEGGESAHGEESKGEAEHAEKHGGEKLLGLDPEATGLVVAAVIVSLLLALAVWLRPGQRAVLLLVAAAMLLFGALDVREAVHQADESNTGLVLLASAIAVLHLGAAAVAVYSLEARGRMPAHGQGAEI
jgi:hypothetical protein